MEQQAKAPALAQSQPAAFEPAWLQACAQELVRAGNLGVHEARLAARTALALYGQALRDDPKAAAARMLEEG